MEDKIILVKILILFIGVSAIGKLQVSETVKHKMYVYNCVYLIVSIYLINSIYFIITILAGILLGLILSKILSRFSLNLESPEIMFLQRELSKVNTAYGMALMRNEQLEALVKSLDKNYANTNSDMRYLLSELSSIYSQNNVSGNYTKLCGIINKIVPLLTRPYRMYIDRNPEMFNQLVTKKDYRRAIKALKEFRDENYLGSGFDKELEYYIELLEKGEKNAISRIQ